MAVGDLHGDWRQARAALQLADVLGPGDRWTGGSSIVVQLGDVLDRGDDEIAILSLLHHLDFEARQQGGAVYLVWLCGRLAGP
eukprot:SM000020S06082  [mRNA]  locus=s20:952356:952818:+ [translate_table: standard]